jgi:hypothetical protein
MLKMSQKGRGLSLTELPIDAHSYVLTFLARDELARYSELNRDCCAVAKLDHLWEPFLAERFAAVTMAGMSHLTWGSTPARQFSKLAQAACTVCRESVLKPNLPGQRYPGAYSCVRCSKLCCAACSCQCSCLKLCNFEKSSAVDVCSRCRGWCHQNLECIAVFGCEICSVRYCGQCNPSLFDCEWCLGIFCMSCCGKGECDECEGIFCEGCRDMSFCDSCSESFCSTCRIVQYCDTCEVSFCDSCGH